MELGESCIEMVGSNEPWGCWGSWLLVFFVTVHHQIVDKNSSTYDLLKPPIMDHTTQQYTIHKCALPPNDVSFFRRHDPRSSEQIRVPVKKEMQESHGLQLHFLTLDFAMHWR